MPKEGLLDRLTNEVLDATEQIAARFEEGLSVLTTGELPVAKEAPSASQAYSVPDLDDMDVDGLTEEEIQSLLQQEMMDSSPLEGIADSVISDIMSKQASPSTPMEHFHAFRSAIRWSEPFILALVAFQIFMFLLCFWVSRKDRGLSVRVGVMLFIAITVRSAEYLNGIGAKNWESFASQDYFDKRGIFVGIMLCGPLLLDCLMMLLFFVAEAGQLLVQVKKQELKSKKGKDNGKSTSRSKTSKQD